MLPCFILILKQVTVMAQFWAMVYLPLFISPNLPFIAVFFFSNLGDKIFDTGIFTSLEKAKVFIVL